MDDHLVLYVDRLITPASLEYVRQAELPGSSGEDSFVHGDDQPTPSTSSGHSIDDGSTQDHRVSEEDEPLVRTAECRICQEEDHISKLEIPCACCGSLKFAHRDCVQRWCDEKGDIMCEICHQQYKPGYTAPPPRTISDDTAIDISGGWTISGTPISLNDPRLLVMAAAERHLLEAEYEDYAATNASGAAFCRSAALILVALLLLRHALIVTNPDDDDSASSAFSLFLLRVAGFLLPCYIMAWVISVLQCRRQRQEAASLAATEVAFVLRSGHQRGLQFTIAPGPATSLPASGNHFNSS